MDNSNGNGRKLFDRGISLGNVISICTTLVAAAFIIGVMQGKFDGLVQRIQRNEQDIQMLWAWVGHRDGQGSGH